MHNISIKLQAHNTTSWLTDDIKVPWQKEQLEKNPVNYEYFANGIQTPF